MMSSSLAGTSGFSRTADVGCPVQNGLEDDPRAFAAKRQCRRSPSRRARRRRRTNRCEHPVPWLAPAPATCTRPCRGLLPGLVRCCSSTVSGLRVCRCILARRTDRRRDLGQPEVENLGMAALGDEDVGGLDVAMDDASRCAASSASAISMARDKRTSVSRGRPAMRWLSVSPSRNSMAMNDWPSCWPISWMVQMLG